MMPSILLPQKVNQMLDPVLFKILHKIKCLWSFEDLILHLSERKVWYLLVAAGASYLLQRWQCVQKTPTSTDGEDERKNPPFSPPFTAKREFHLSLSNSVQTICNALHNTTSGIASMCQMLSNDGLDILVDKGITSCPQEVQSNRNADDIFSVNPIHVKTEHSVLASNCNLNITSDAVMKEQQLKDESLTSTSPCCSSTEAGISGAVNHSSVLQSYDVPFQFHEKEQSYEPIWQYGFYQSVDKEPKSQSIELHRHEMNTALGEDLGDNQRDAFDLIQKQSHEASQYPNCGKHEDKSLNYHHAFINDGMVSDSYIHTPITFTPKWWSNTEGVDCPYDDSDCSSSLNPGSNQNVSQTVTMAIGPELLQDDSATSEKSFVNAESDAIISFGLAMAVCFMVSSAKREIDKMEKILRETENLISFMGRELAERKFQSGSTGEDDDLFTDITEATVGRISAPKNVEKHINNLSNNGSFEGPLTRTGPIADTSQNHMHECNSEAADRVPSHDKVIDSEIGDTNNGQQQVIHGWDFKNENDYGGESDSECVISLIELQKSLWAVFHQIQEEKVSELEATLKSALHKLHIKEEEACWWKRLAYHLMEQFDSSIDGLQSGFPINHMGRS